MRKRKELSNTQYPHFKVINQYIKNIKGKIDCIGNVNVNAVIFFMHKQVVLHRKK